MRSSDGASSDGTSSGGTRISSLRNADMADGVRVLVVDDHAVTHLGLRLLFAADPRYRIIGNLQQGMLVGSFMASQPVDLVLLDLQLPDIRGIHVLAEIIGLHDSTVIVLTETNDFSEVEYALRLGARAAVSKSDKAGEILAACNAALGGEVYISSTMKKTLVESGRSPVTLSPRQTVILHYLAQGASSKEIGGHLAIAAPTVSFHVAELMRKLNVRDDRSILVRARELNLL